MMKRLFIDPTRLRVRAAAGTASVLCGLAFTFLAVPVHADQAICVGVNHYTNIPGADLQGCVNDATSMQSVLQKYHFQVTLLTDKQATKQGILDALKTVAAEMKPGERFAFYFAGHGTPDKNKASNLLPSNADLDDETNDLSAKELYDAVSDIPAASRTVILDSCFSGGMLRSTRGLMIGRPDFHSRVFIRPGMRDHEGNSRDLVLVNNSDTNTKLTGTTAAKPSNICYVTASRQNEQSGEDKFGGQHDGVFTHYLVQDMSATPPPKQWSDVSTKVNAQVNQYTDDQQHPTLSPAFSNAPVFGGGAAAVTNASYTTMGSIKTSSLWDAYNADHANPFGLLLSMNPNQTTVNVGDKLSFTINIGAAGYLLILEHGVSGNLNLLYPASGSIGDAVVKTGQTVTIPSDSSQAYAPDQAGTERVKAMLFSSKDAAAALLASLPQGHSLPYSDMRSLPATASAKSKFVTSDITFEVAPAAAP